MGLWGTLLTHSLTSALRCRLSASPICAHDTVGALCECDGKVLAATFTIIPLLVVDEPSTASGTIIGCPLPNQEPTTGITAHQGPLGCLLILRMRTTSELVDKWEREWIFPPFPSYFFAQFSEAILPTLNLPFGPPSVHEVSSFANKTRTALLLLFFFGPRS